MNRNSTDFPLYLKQFSNDIKSKYSENKDIAAFLKFHQYVILKYVLQNPKQRGLLIFHGMGTGKTILAVAIAEECRKFGCLYSTPAEHKSKHGKAQSQLLTKPRKIIILMAKSLESNFKQTIKKYNSEILSSTQRADERSPDEVPNQTEFDSSILDSYSFVSLNASNMYEQTQRIGQPMKFKQCIESELMDLGYDRRLGDFTRIYSDRKQFENSLLIVDEAHNLFNAICNGSKNALHLYDAIMNTRNMKLLFLTGSPIINTPFEIVPCFNMLTAQNLPSLSSRELEKSAIDASQGKKERQRKSSHVPPLLTEYRHEFEEYFINDNTIKNKEFLSNRIVGLTSYYGDFGTVDISQETESKSRGASKREHFPEQLSLKLEVVHMSPMQYELYDSARELERAETSRNKFGRTSTSRFHEKGGAGIMSSTYRIKSRQLSNFVFPEHAVEEILISKDKTSKKRYKRIKHINKITNEDLDNLDVYSPKLKKLLENINGVKFPQLIYSEFVSGEGLAIIRLLLEKNKYANWENIRDTVDAELGVDFKRPSDVYAIISGEVDVELRTEILEEFNKLENMHGERIKLLLISKTGAEGLDCKYIRAVHILEPFWNYIRIEQIIARAVRYKSHDDLPPEERKVQPYIYLSTYPKDMELVKISTIDELGDETGLSPKSQSKQQYFSILKQLPAKSARLIDSIDADHKKSLSIELTTDLEIFKKSIENKVLISEFLNVLIESSCDCFVHMGDSKLTCKMCSPTGVLLYTDSLARDIRMPNPCIEPKEEEIAVKEIIITDKEENIKKKFYYRKLPMSTPQALHTSQFDIELYEYNKDSGTYMLMQRTHPYYSILIDQIMKSS